jgi:hypothetical protein
VEELSEKHSIKWTKFKGGKKLLVCAAISLYGPEQLYFIEDKENTDFYEEILDTLFSIYSKASIWEIYFLTGEHRLLTGNPRCIV